MNTNAATITKKYLFYFRGRRFHFGLRWPTAWPLPSLTAILIVEILIVFVVGFLAGWMAGR